MKEEWVEIARAALVTVLPLIQADAKAEAMREAAGILNNRIFEGWLALSVTALRELTSQREAFLDRAAEYDRQAKETGE